MTAAIRPAIPADTEAIDGILRRARREAYAGLVAEGELGLGRDGRRALERGFGRHERRDGVLLVAQDTGTVVGFVDAGPTGDPGDDPGAVGQVYAVYVDPQRWRGGVGGMLMRAAESGLAAAGFDQATLWVRETNARARSFYEAIGWSPDGDTKQSVIAGRVPITELRYRRRL